MRTPSPPPHSPPCPICGVSFDQAPPDGAYCVDGFQLVHAGKCMAEYRKREKERKQP